jgi:hypothetical protein
MGTELETRLWLANVFCCRLIESSPIRSLAGRLPYGDWLTGQLAEVYLIWGVPKAALCTDGLGPGYAMCFEQDALALCVSEMRDEAHRPALDGRRGRQTAVQLRNCGTAVEQFGHSCARERGAR